MNAGLTGWFLISFHLMPATYSFDRARGCRSYQSSTSLSVSNTGDLRVSNKTLMYDHTRIYVQCRYFGFCYRMIITTELTQGSRSGKESLRATRMRLSSRSVEE